MISGTLISLSIQCHLCEEASSHVHQPGVHTLHSNAHRLVSAGILDLSSLQSTPTTTALFCTTGPFSPRNRAGMATQGGKGSTERLSCLLQATQPSWGQDQLLLW